MRSHIGDLPVEITRPESPKFTRPLLLLHGLWTGSWIWERVTPYLAYRGWESWAPSMLAGRTPLGLDAGIAAAVAVAARMPAPPVVIAHDAGAVVAAVLAARAAAAAVVMLAPIVPPHDAGGVAGVLGWRRLWVRRWWGMRVMPPNDPRLLGGAPPATRGRLVADSGATFRALASSRFRLPPPTDVPGLVVSGADDPASPPSLGAALASRFAWPHLVQPDRGHFLMLESGWEGLAAEVHRWVVQTLGADLLALLDEQED